MSTESLSSSKCRQTACPQINVTTIQQIANKSSKFSILLGGVATATAIINLNPASAIAYVSYAALSWLGFRTVSYFCTKPKNDLFNSELDAQQGLKISDKVKVVAFSATAHKICKAINLASSDVLVTPLKSRIERMEFIASNELVMNFLRHMQAHREEAVTYTLSPIYDDTREKFVPSSKSLCGSVDLKISAFINLVVFTPKKCCQSVKVAISRNRKEQMRQNSPQTFTETGVARWETLGALKEPGPYENCEKDECEEKITTEIHQSDLLKTLSAIVKVHSYHEVGYDVYLSYTPYEHTKIGNQKSARSKLVHKILKYAKFLFSNQANFKLSSNVKLIVCAPIDLADRVRKIIGEKKGGLIGNYAHCSFTIGESEESKTATSDLKVRIETVVAKILFREIMGALQEFRDKITYSLHPMFERIDTKKLRQKQHLRSAITAFFTS